MPRPGESTTPPGGPARRAPGSPGAAAGAADVPGAGTPGASGAPARVDLNTADDAALEELPGIGPVLAGRIVAWRTEHGRFSDVSELGEVSGIGEKMLAELGPLVTV